MPSVDVGAEAMGAVVDPFPRCRDPFAGGNGRGVADHRHQFPVSPRLGPKDAEPILDIVEGNALDKARQGFLGRRCRGCLHAGYFVNARVSCVVARGWRMPPPSSRLHGSHFLLDPLNRTSPEPK